MDSSVKNDSPSPVTPSSAHPPLFAAARPIARASGPSGKSKGRKLPDDADSQDSKRKCVSSACIACRKRKSKCDGNLPACAACSSVYGTPCVYDPNSDHRRKGVYKQDIDNLKTRNSTLQTLIQAILNYPEEDVPELVRDIRTCESLDKVAENIIAQGKDLGDKEESEQASLLSERFRDNDSFEAKLSSQLGRMRFDDGTFRYVGGTSHLFQVSDDDEDDEFSAASSAESAVDPVASWTTVTRDSTLITHLLNMYFTWHYPFFTTLSKHLFMRDFAKGKPGKRAKAKGKSKYCTPLLVNSMLALGCHFSSLPGARDDPSDSATTGDHFFREARRLKEEDEYARPSLATVQAMALMSVREAGCARESKGWYYSGLAFRMAMDLGLNFRATGPGSGEADENDEDEDVRRITFWGCFLFDKCWSNYMGRLPLFQTSNNITIPKPEVFPSEEAEPWSPYGDSGFCRAHEQPLRARAVALQISALSDINGDLMRYFYHPQQLENPPSRQTELKRLSDIHARLETWKRELPREFEPREGCLASVLVMHMLFQLLYIHLFRPFLKYDPDQSPLPQHVSPRKLVTQAASTVSKLLRLYKRSYGLRQICNISVYIIHSACVIHLLNAPEKNAKRDVTHGFKHLEEIAEGWLCARRTLKTLGDYARKWRVDLTDEAKAVLQRCEEKYETASPRTPRPSALPLSNSMSKDNQAQRLAQHPDDANVKRPQWNGWLDPSAVLQSNAPTAQQGNTLDWLKSRRNGNGELMNGTNGADDFSMANYGDRLRNSSFAYPSANAVQTTNLMPNAAQPIHGQQGYMNRNGILTANEYARIAKTQPQHNPDYGSFAAPNPLTGASHRPLVRDQSAPDKRNNLPSATDPMFGGVDSLLQDDSEWWVHEPSSVASQFNKWGIVNDHGHNVQGMMNASGAVRNNSAIGDETHRKMNMPTTVGATGVAKDDPVSTTSLDWGGIDAIQHTLNDGYNEEDWYQ